MRPAPSHIALFLMTFVVVMIEGSEAFLPHTSHKVRALTLLRGGSENPINSGELVSTLAKLDQQWNIQQSQPRSPKSRWTKIMLDAEDADVGAVDPQQVAVNQGQQDFVYLLEPPSLPSCVIVFLGGAGLGQYPHIAYNELLLRVSDKLNAAVIAAPYTVGLDHFGIAKQAGEKLRKGIVACQDDKQYSQTLPIYCFGHSLGCKLQSIYMAATSQDFDGVGFISFNNFSFSQTIGMARDFADQLRQASNKQNAGIPGSAEGVLNQLFGLAETAVSAIGLDFTPTPEDMRRLLQLKYADGWKPKTRLFCFDDDTLDSTPDFITSCGSAVSVSCLPGNHLTPVYLQIKLEDYMTELPEEARAMASQAMDGFQGVSFGNEEELNVLVDEMCSFVLGKPPSRRPGTVDSPLIEGNMGEAAKNR
ncbi:Protein of unknown function (DUF1350) [Fragilaria crotonensis]|nr:Protein of unknown function (DUF1350) [Fragilaria crotonensis]